MQAWSEQVAFRQPIPRFACSAPDEVTPFRGTIRISVENAKTNKHYYAKYGKDLTLEQYLYVKHGIVLKNPEARLVYFSVVEGDRGLASASPLPQKLLTVVDEANPKK